MAARVWTATLAAFLAAAGSIVIGSGPAQAAVSGVWKVDCTYTHSAADDPIVKPGQPGASHEHDFFGNVGVNAYSTYESMDGVTSTCADDDRSAYWTPAVYRNGVKAPVTSMIVYYENRFTDATVVQPFPPGFQLVFGNAMATTAAQEDVHITWGCSDNTQIVGKEPPASCSTGIIQLRTQWPNCWDGKTTNGNSTGHVTYHDKNNTCSGAYPIALPGLRTNTYFKVGTTTGTITLASGSIYSAHADFFNAWDQTELTRLVDTCLNGHKDCGHLKGTSPGKAPATASPSPSAATTTPPSADPHAGMTMPMTGPATTAAASSAPATATAACTASFRVATSWSGGYQGAVTVTAGTAIRSWTTKLPSPVAVGQVWNGVTTGAGTVTSTTWNGTLAAGGTTTYGFIGTGSAPAAPVPVSCSS